MKSIWLQQENLQHRVLDSYDFTPYLQTCDTMSELWYKFSTDHDNDENLPPEMEHCVFNFCSFEYLIEYLEERYKDDYVFTEITDVSITDRRRSVAN